MGMQFIPSEESLSFRNGRIVRQLCTYSGNDPRGVSYEQEHEVSEFEPSTWDAIVAELTDEEAVGFRAACEAHDAAEIAHADAYEGFGRRAA